MEKYIPIPVSERISKIKEEYAKNVLTVRYAAAADIPGYCENNTGDALLSLGFLKGWFENNKMLPLRLRRSYAEASELDEAKPVVFDHEIIAGQLYFPEYTKEEQELYDRLAKEYSDTILDLSTQGARKDHITLDFDKLINVGVEAVLDEVKRKRAELSYADYDFEDLSGIEKIEFYDCLTVELEALLRLEKRYSEKLYDLSEKAEGKRKAELLRMADALAKVPAKPAESFYEAVQSVHFFLSNLFGLYPLGRPDRYFARLYEADVKSGKITASEAQELIDCLCLGVSCRVFSRAACGFVVGGSDANGNLYENDLTYMFITALEHIRMADPNGALAVNEKTSDRILNYAVDVISEGCTHPAFYNDKAIVNSLVEYGVKREDAVNFIHSTCAEITVAGKSKGHTTTIALNIPQTLLDTVKANKDFKSIDELIDAYCDNIAKELYSAMKRYLQSVIEAARNGNEPMRIAAFVDDCVAKGKGLYDGGARYCHMLPIFIGFATAVDSLEAIRKLVYEDRKYTLSELYDIVDRDFEGNEPLRKYILNRVEHYGNDLPTVDAHAAEFAKRLEEIVTKRRMPGSRYLFPGTFSYINHAVMGGVTKATFDGRRAWTSLSDGCCPSQGMDISGPTALINSLTSWDQSKFLAGMVVNLKFSKSDFSGEKKELLAKIVRTFMAKGGLELQVNSVDRATLEDAKIHPEKHRELLVRIGGYSDYFVRLDPVLQQEIIDRTEY